MHTKALNSSSPTKDPVSTMKKSKQQQTGKSSEDVAMSGGDLEADECFWKIAKASCHPVVLAKINRLRRKDTDSKLFRELMYEIGTFLAYEATSDLTLTDSKTVKADH